MDVTAKSKHVRMPPRKARDLARELRGKPAKAAVMMMQFGYRKAAREISKTLQSAIANAEANHNLAVEKLRVKKAVVDEGTRIRRHWPRPRGSVSPIAKRTCHITIVLTDDEGAAR